MMKYLVKVVYTATDNNPNFAGEVKTYWCGKEEHSEVDTYCRWFVEEYGYARRCDAKRNYHMRPENQNNEKFWTKTAEIVEVVY